MSQLSRCFAGIGCALGLVLLCGWVGLSYYALRGHAQTFLAEANTGMPGVQNLVRGAAPIGALILVLLAISPVCVLIYYCTGGPWNISRRVVGPVGFIIRWFLLAVLCLLYFINLLERIFMGKLSYSFGSAGGEPEGFFEALEVWMHSPLLSGIAEGEGWLWVEVYSIVWGFILAVILQAIRLLAEKLRPLYSHKLRANKNLDPPLN